MLSLKREKPDNNDKRIKAPAINQQSPPFIDSRKRFGAARDVV
jgi:hypothetical protein